MYNHVTAGYKCPICLGVQGEETKDTMLKKSDLIYKDDLVSVFVNSFFIEGNEGHTIIVPNKHFENLYELDSEYGHRIMDVSKKVARAMKKAYKCDGVTIRQNNEPASSQHALHYHMHIFPRYTNDNFDINITKSRPTTSKERTTYINKFKGSLSK